jgi:hypothetical protein
MASIQITVPNWLDRIFTWPVMVYRQCKFGYPFRRIPLTESKFAIVDQADFYHFNNFDWCAKREHRCFYAVRFNNHCDKGPKILSLHRQIMKPPPGLLVDHKNSDSLDNRRANLRLATRSQNVQNSQKRNVKATSRFIGVHLEKKSGRWAVKIVYEGKKVWLGRFKDEVEAAKAHDRAAIKYHGEFAKLNFP